jgi:CheY-like chemotaxis protein
MPEKLVLVADTDPEMHRLLGAALSTEHFRTIAVGNGEEALSLARTEHPELIVTDLSIPELDGFAVVDQLKSDPLTAAIPVLAVTGAPYPELQQRARLAGFDALLIKPVTATTLADVGRLLVERAALLKERSAWLRQRGAAARARATGVQRTAEATRAAAASPSAETSAAPPAAPKCRRCGSDADSHVVRTTRSSVTYRCGTCQGQWRLTFKSSRASSI